jgi:DNA polymerase beta
MDYKPLLIENLAVLEKFERQAKNVFKARAYGKVLREIKAIDGPIHTEEQVMSLPGVGKSLHEKIKEIFETGRLQRVKDIEDSPGFNVAEQFLKIYGVGPVKADELARKHRMRSIEELRQHPELLNEKQLIGLKYYEDINERIPRKEMLLHQKQLMRRLKEVDERFEGEIVGSFRRGAVDSGDIDILVKMPSSVPSPETLEAFQRFIHYLQGTEYVTDILATGPKKFMGISKLSKKHKARRLDVLLTPEEEYPYAVFYFTGSDKFNVAMRKKALEKGYTMNEHGMKPVSRETPVPKMSSEKDIMAFLGYKYIPPKQRQGEDTLQKYALK